MPEVLPRGKFLKKTIYSYTSLVDYVVENMKDGYPELVEKREYIEKVVRLGRGKDFH